MDLRAIIIERAKTLLPWAMDQIAKGKVSNPDTWDKLGDKELVAEFEKFVILTFRQR